jgi:hypothetical protein
MEWMAASRTVHVCSRQGLWGGSLLAGLAAVSLLAAAPARALPEAGSSPRPALPQQVVECLGTHPLWRG